MVLSVLLPLGGCGIFDEKGPEAFYESVAPGTEKVTDDWHCIADEKSRWDCFQSASDEAANTMPVSTAPEPVKQLEEVLEVESAEVGDDLGDEQTDESTVKSNQAWQKLSAQAFVLQIAAHTSRANAEAALIALDAPGAEIIKTWSDAGDVFVIIAGSYADKAEAEAAAEAFSGRNEGGDYWIRSTSHLLKAL